MKNLKKVLALVLAVVMIMSVVTVASAKTYTDVKATDNYADAIDALSSLKILDGFKDGDNYSFKAEDPFTRAQAAKIVAIVPVVWIVVVITSPLLAAFAAYDLVFLGWGSGK